MWKGRFEEDTNALVQEFTQSLDMDWRMAECDIQGSIAHARMLVKVGLLNTIEGEEIISALQAVATEIRHGAFVPKIELEDVHMNIEARVTELIGSVGAKLHTGRSRNDQVATTLRLYLRQREKDMRAALLSLMNTLLDMSQKHEDVIVPGYTHLQQAQPISMGHYWMSYFWDFAHDMRRLDFARTSLMECPLGSGALAGSTLPLDRRCTSAELGFSAPTQNSLRSVASRDHLMDLHSFALGVAIHASRMSEDLIIYASHEFGWLVLPDGYCTGSSMMPQKKNPDVLEIIRGKTGGMLGRLVDLATSLKGLPMTYNRDLQEDKRGMFATLDTTEQIIRILTPLVRTVEVNQEAAMRGFDDGLALATDVAEYLVLRGVPFRHAHEGVGRAVRHCLDNKIPMHRMTLEEWQALIPQVRADLLPLLDIRTSVSRRSTYGGTAFSEVARQRKEGRALLGI